ncbi:MAG: HAD family phosphatase [Tunicatimonas sp.]
MEKPAVIFDMDGVIVDNHRYHLQSWLSFFEQHDIRMTEEEYKAQVNGRVMHTILPQLLGRSLSPEEIRRFGDQKEEAYRDAYRDHIRPTPGLVAFLEELRQQNVPRAIATSAPPANVTFTLDHTKLRPYFPVIVDDTMVTQGKPDPEVYLLSAAQLNMPPERCIVFEDAILGIQAGKNAGMYVVGVATTHTREELKDTEADYVVDNFEGLTVEKLLKALV